MAGYVAVPQNLMGRTINEICLKGALRRLNPDMNFDWGGNLNLWHPWQEGKQGVYFKSKHLCSMDRGQIPQAPIWSTKKEVCRIEYADSTIAERSDPFFAEEVEYRLDGTEVPTGWVFVNREVKDRLLWVGWQATLRKIINHDIPGITALTLSKELGVTVDVMKEVEALEVEESRTHLYDASGRSIEV
jgi:hypothetical protein